MTVPTLIRRYVILGERRLTNYLWSIVLSLGSLGFLAAGLASYTHRSDLLFFPQGLLMCFYGSLGMLVSLYWWLLILWNVGSGFNELNKREGSVRIFRWGYPGKNRRIDVTYALTDVQAIRVELKQGWDPQRTIYLKLKGKPDIPLTGVTEPLTLKEIEKQASELANFLQVSLEGLSCFVLFFFHFDGNEVAENVAEEVENEVKMEDKKIRKKNNLFSDFQII